MNKTCPCCEQKFYLEPSFYVGAMYVSYALQVALFVAVIVAIKVLFPKATTSTYVITIVITVIVLTPLIFRLSRSIWIHFFVKYDKEAKICD
jgi:hypothetical protein